MRLGAGSDAHNHSSWESLPTIGGRSHALLLLRSRWDRSFLPEEERPMATPVKHFALIVLALPLAAAPLAAQEPNQNAPFGVPHSAAANLKHRDAYRIARPQYVLSYNAEARTPNWVCWRLRKEDIGNAPRGAFEPDPDLPKGI